jgi:hypothetical protein
MRHGRYRSISRDDAWVYLGIGGLWTLCPWLGEDRAQCKPSLNLS